MDAIVNMYFVLSETLYQPNYLLLLQYSSADKTSPEQLSFSSVFIKLYYLRHNILTIT